MKTIEEKLKELEGKYIIVSLMGDKGEINGMLVYEEDFGIWEIKDSNFNRLVIDPGKIRRIEGEFVYIEF